ncbi:MAG: divergent polysaccharide deacetylase family protein [Thermodesulfobacteriota bacterium]
MKRKTGKPGKRRAGKGKGAPLFTPAAAVLIVVAFVLGAVIAALIGGYIDTGSVPPEETGVAAVPVVPPPPPPRPMPPTPPAPTKASVRVAFVIDDMGGGMKRLRELAEVSAPVTVAVLPHLRYSKEVAREAHAKGMEVLLHLPMEPRDAVTHDPGEGALLTAMTEDEVRLRTRVAIDAIPYITGVNNHMGSRFTEDERLMRAALDVVGERDFLFLDSRTSNRSVGGRVGRELGVRTVERNVFLDNTRDEEYIRGQVEELVAIARKRGGAIGIGHPYPETIAVLLEMIPALIEDGVEVVRLSDLVAEAGGGAKAPGGPGK